MRKLTVRLADDQHRKLARVAKRKETTVTQLLRDAAEFFIAYSDRGEDARHDELVDIRRRLDAIEDQLSRW